MARVVGLSPRSDTDMASESETEDPKYSDGDFAEDKGRDRPGQNRRQKQPFSTMSSPFARSVPEDSISYQLPEPEAMQTGSDTDTANELDETDRFTDIDQAVPLPDQKPILNWIKGEMDETPNSPNPNPVVEAVAIQPLRKEEEIIVHAPPGGIPKSTIRAKKSIPADHQARVQGAIPKRKPRAGKFIPNASSAPAQGAVPKRMTRSSQHIPDSEFDWFSAINMNFERIIRAGVKEPVVTVKKAGEHSTLKDSDVGGTEELDNSSPPAFSSNLKEVKDKLRQKLDVEIEKLDTIEQKGQVGDASCLEEDAKNWDFFEMLLYLDHLKDGCDKLEKELKSKKSKAKK